METVQTSMCKKSIQCIIFILLVLFYTVRCKECGDTSDSRTKDLCLQLYAGVSLLIPGKSYLLALFPRFVASGRSYIESNKS